MWEHLSSSPALTPIFSHKWVKLTSSLQSICSPNNIIRNCIMQFLNGSLQLFSSVAQSVEGLVTCHLGRPVGWGYELKPGTPAQTQLLDSS